MLDHIYKKYSLF